MSYHSLICLKSTKGTMSKSNKFTRRSFLRKSNAVTSASILASTGALTLVPTASAAEGDATYTNDSSHQKTITFILRWYKGSYVVSSKQETHTIQPGDSKTVNLPKPEGEGLIFDSSTEWTP